MLPESPKAGEKYRILVIEDDVSIGRLVTSGLTKVGFECRHALDGSTGLEAFQEMNPHLVVLDIMMPGLDGRQVCTKIRESSNVPIIMLTALDEEEDQMQALRMGADDYVHKPFTPKLLVARVMSHLRRVYRYDDTENGKTSAPGTTQASKVPAGWGLCGGCGYMGPREKLEQQDITGRRYLQCPACKQRDRITFPSG
jgi:DNA-binding response OmpR family regulator